MVSCAHGILFRGCNVSFHVAAGFNEFHTYRINLQDKNLLQSKGYFLLPNDIVIGEPIKSKPFQLNIPTTTLIITATLSTISTTILLLNYFNNQ